MKCNLLDELFIVHRIQWIQTYGQRFIPTYVLLYVAYILYLFSPTYVSNNDVFFVTNRKTRLLLMFAVIATGRQAPYTSSFQPI